MVFFESCWVFFPTSQKWFGLYLFQMQMNLPLKHHMSLQLWHSFWNSSWIINWTLSKFQKLFDSTYKTLPPPNKPNNIVFEDVPYSIALSTNIAVNSPNIITLYGTPNDPIVAQINPINSNTNSNLVANLNNLKYETVSRFFFLILLSVWPPLSMNSLKYLLKNHTINHILSYIKQYLIRITLVKCSRFSCLVNFHSIIHYFRFVEDHYPNLIFSYSHFDHRTLNFRCRQTLKDFYCIYQRRTSFTHWNDKKSVEKHL